MFIILTCGGRGGWWRSERGRRRSSCWEEREDSRARENYAFAGVLGDPRPWAPPLTHSASGGQEESRVHTEVAPTHCLS